MNLLDGNVRNLVFENNSRAQEQHIWKFAEEKITIKYVEEKFKNKTKEKRKYPSLRVA